MTSRIANPLPNNLVNIFTIGHVIQPVNIFIGGLDDVRNVVDSLNSQALVIALESKSRTHIDVVTDGHGILLIVLASPILDHKISRTHCHGQATKLNCGCVHVFKCCIAR